MKRILLTFLALWLSGCSTAGKNPVRDVQPGGILFPDGSERKDEEVKSAPDVADVRQDVEQGIPPGYMEKCFTDADCSAWGLKCFAEGPQDNEAVCSSPCNTNADCLPGLLCKEKGEEKLCMPAEYCDLCDNDSQCGKGGRCIPDKSGAKFCTFKCVKDDPMSCAAGNYCNKVGQGLEDYYCFPMFGQCKGDGSHCTPCQKTTDCLKSHVCHENAYTHEKYCAKVCQTKQDCPKGFLCAHLLGEEQDLCTLDIDGQPVETCYKGMKGFCEPCQHDYECTSGVCYNYPVANRYFCSFFCDKDKYGQTGCPPGLFCVPNHGESGGEVCAPAPAFGCQGFLNCVAVECPKGMVCKGGFCEPK